MAQKAICHFQPRKNDSALHVLRNWSDMLKNVMYFMLHRRNSQLFHDSSAHNIAITHQRTARRGLNLSDVLVSRIPCSYGSSLEGT